VEGRVETWVKRVIQVLSVIAVFVFIYRIRAVLTPLLFAVIIAYLANPLVDCLEKREIPRGMSILIAYLIFGLTLFLFLALVIPPLSREIDQILTVLPDKTNRLQELTRQTLEGVKRIEVPATLEQGFSDALIRLEAAAEGFVRRLVEVAVLVVSRFFVLLISPILAFYMLRDWPRAQKALVHYLPEDKGSYVMALLSQVNEVASGFIRGQLIVSSFVGVTIALSLTILDIQFAFLIGLLAGLFDVIPYFGPIIGALPALALAFAESPVVALWVAVVFVVVNQIEGGLLSPKIMGDRVGLHPVMVIMGILIGGELAGIVGMLIAVPTVACARVIIDFLLTYRPEHFKP